VRDTKGTLALEVGARTKIHKVVTTNRPGGPIRLSVHLVALVRVGEHDRMGQCIAI
jgi:hypothetical protein